MIRVAVIDEASTQAEKVRPNRITLGSLLNGIGNVISATASLQPAWQTVKDAATALYGLLSSRTARPRGEGLPAISPERQSASNKAVEIAFAGTYMVPDQKNRLFRKMANYLILNGAGCRI